MCSASNYRTWTKNEADSGDRQNVCAHLLGVMGSRFMLVKLRIIRIVYTCIINPMP